MSNQPMQPIILSRQPQDGPNGVVRFRPNAIVQWLIDEAVKGNKVDLNRIAKQNFGADDRMQFAMLIGYSVSSFGDLSYAAAEVVAEANRLAMDVAPQAGPTPEHQPTNESDRERELRLARESEADCTIGTGAGPGKYTREVAERLRRAHAPATNGAPDGRKQVYTGRASTPTKPDVRIEQPARTVTWEETASVAVGFRPCDGCWIETPEPATSVLVEFAKLGGGRYLWPFDAGFSSGWMWKPPGWTEGEGTPGALHCPDCTRAIREAVAFALRRKNP